SEEDIISFVRRDLCPNYPEGEGNSHDPSSSPMCPSASPCCVKLFSLGRAHQLAYRDSRSSFLETLPCRDSIEHSLSWGFRSCPTLWMSFDPRSRRGRRWSWSGLACRSGQPGARWFKSERRSFPWRRGPGCSITASHSASNGSRRSFLLAGPKPCAPRSMLAIADR